MRFLPGLDLFSQILDGFGTGSGIVCKTRGYSNFMRKDKIVIAVKIQNFSRFRMTKRTSPLESSREI